MRARTVALGAAAAAAFSSAAVAAPVCTTQSLSNYIGLGSGGCTVNDETFTSFAYSQTNTGEAASDVTVAPQPSANNPGLMFSAHWQGTTIAFSLSFDVAAGPAKAVTDASLSFDFTSGAPVDTETLSAGGKTIASLTLDTSTFPFTRSTTFSGVASLSQSESLTGTGFTIVNEVTKTFSETPVPVPVPKPSPLASLALLGIGLSALGLTGRRGRLRRS
jgi:hypothetical protein